MPMIEAKVIMQLPVEKRDILKAEFGKAISIIGKPLRIFNSKKNLFYFFSTLLIQLKYVQLKV